MSHELRDIRLDPKEEQGVTKLQSNESEQESKLIPKTKIEVDKLDNDDQDEEDDEDEEDDDYDPEAKPLELGEDEEDAAESAEEDNEPQPDYSAIQSSGISEIKTRHQRQLEREGLGPSLKKEQLLRVDGLIHDDSGIDVNLIFEDLKQSSKNPRLRSPNDEEAGPDLTVDDSSPHINGSSRDGVSAETKPINETNTDTLSANKIRIQTSYTFAGRVITESKIVDADSAEAKAYLNSTNGLATKLGEESTSNLQQKLRSEVPIIREVPGTGEQKELRIKLKRPSLIDKFLSTFNNKRLKLSTLEKSRLDWASFVDQRKLQDDLKIHNKAGFLDKQEFLGRLDAKRDEQYVIAREAERKRQWQLQQQQQP